MRFASRNVEQIDNKVFDNIVVCEVYRSTHGSEWGMGQDDGDDSGSLAELIMKFSDDGLKQGVHYSPHSHFSWFHFSLV